MKHPHRKEMWLKALHEASSPERNVVKRASDRARNVVRSASNRANAAHVVGSAHARAHLALIEVVENIRRP